jgi:tRNA nucleotidyltransferase/poly(A) polymerase
MKGLSHLRDAAWLRDDEVARLLALLDRDGEEARVGGGAVRNTLLRLPVAEIDVATRALLEEAMRRVRAAGGKAADRHRARHRHCHHRSSPGRGHDAAARWRNLCC